MDAGFYVNLFEVSFPDTPIEFMRVERSKYPDLRSLRGELADKYKAVRVYSSHDVVYGYGGRQADTLVNYGFVKVTVLLKEIPEVTGRMILEGLVECLEMDGYQSQEQKGRAAVFDFRTAVLVTSGGARLCRGYDLRSLFLKDPASESLFFGTIVDVAYAYTDSQGARLNTHEIVARFGSEALQAMRQKQGDILPNRRINLEVSRQRLTEHILPFVQKYRSFTMPCGIEATLSAEPVRVILTGEERGI
jgi:hypothetical protein